MVILAGPPIAVGAWGRACVVRSNAFADPGARPVSTLLDLDPIQPEQSRRPGRRIWLPLAFVAIAVLVIGSLTTGLLYAFTVDKAVNDNLRRQSVMPRDAPGRGVKPRPTRPPAGSRGHDAQNYVLIGADDSAGGVSRSDALLVLHLAADRRSAYLLSFPRDLWVPIPGYGRNKINAAYAFGGAELTVATLEGLLDVRMDHVAQVDLDGFVGLTDELGGARVYNKHPSVSSGHSFPAGWITISGEQALAYVRERKQLPRGDLDRSERPRSVDR